MLLLSDLQFILDINTKFDNKLIIDITLLASVKSFMCGDAKSLRLSIFIFYFHGYCTRVYELCTIR